jgi:hypothetical protein
MYGIELNISGNYFKELNGMFDSFKSVKDQTKQMQGMFDTIKVPSLNIPKNPFKTDGERGNTGNTETNSNVNESVLDTIGKVKDQMKGITDTGKEANKPMMTIKESMTKILGSVMDIKGAYDLSNETLKNIPQKWTTISDSIIGARRAINTGDWGAFTESIKGGFTETMTVLNEFRVYASVVRDGLSKLGEIPAFAKIKEMAGGALKAIGNMGLNLITQTLPNVLMFAGRSVLSMGTYTMSLIGATGAQAALNAVMLANPVGVVVAGLAAVGGALYGVWTYWDNIKKYLVGFGEFFIKFSPFGWIFEITNKLFPNLGQSVKNTFGGIMDWLNKYFIEPISKIFNWVIEKSKWLLGEVSKPFTVDINGTQEMGAFFNIDQDKTMTALKDTFKPTGIKGLPKFPKHESLGIDKRNKEITGEKREIKNINVNIQKQIEKVEIHIDKSVDIGLKELEYKLRTLLADTTNQVNYSS